jgi:hypothetical protein
LEDDNDDDDDDGEEEKKKAFNEAKRHYQYSISYIQDASLTLCFHH